MFGIEMYRLILSNKNYKKKHYSCLVVAIRVGLNFGHQNVLDPKKKNLPSQTFFEKSRI